MDYVIFGIGMGASLVLFGLGSRTLGPSLRYRNPSGSGEVLRAEELVARIAWGRFCSSLGVTIAIGGVFLLAVTGMAMLLRLGDRAATICVLLAVLLVGVMMVLWAWAFVNRFGLYGIVTEREMRTRQMLPVDDAPAPVSDEEPEAPTGPPPVVTATRRLPNQPAPQPQTRPVAPESPAIRRQPQPQQSVEATPATPSPAFKPAVGQNQPQEPEANDSPTGQPGNMPASPQPAVGKPRTFSRQPVEPANEEMEDPSPAAPVPGPQETETRPTPAPQNPDVVDPDDAAALERILNTPDEQLRGPQGQDEE